MQGRRGPRGFRGGGGPSDWALVAATLGAGLITAVAAIAAGVLGWRVAKQQLRQEEARADAAEREVRKQAYSALVVTARLYDPRAAQEQNRLWEAGFNKQLDEAVLASGHLRDAAQSLRSSYEQMRFRLVKALQEGEDQFKAEVIDVARNWSGTVNRVAAGAERDLNA